VGCVLGVIVETVFEGLLWLVLYVVGLIVAYSWPGFVAGLAAGAAVLWIGEYRAWPLAVGVFVVVWAVGGELYAGRRPRPPKRTWPRKTRDRDDGFIR